MGMKLLRILLIIIVVLLSFSLGTMLGMTVVHATEPERIGIFTQPDGTQVIEICYEDSKCEQKTVSWKEIERMEKEE